MAFQMKGWSPFKQKEHVKSETVVTRSKRKKKSTTTTNIASDEGSSTNIKSSTKTKYRSGKVKFKRSILKTDPEGNITSTVTKDDKVKTYKGKRAVRKHKRV